MSESNFKQITGVVIKVFSDQLLKLSYATILTPFNCQKVKLPTSFENYKYNYLLRPNYLLTLEAVKTRKNWILKSVVNYQEILNLSNYHQFEIVSQMCQKLNDKVKENQEVDSLNLFLDFLQNKELKLSLISEFETSLNKNLGFQV